MSRPHAATLQILEVDGRRHRVEVHRRVRKPADAPRLVVVAYQPNGQAVEILRACLRAVGRFTPEPHELWVVDNNSPRKAAAWLLEWPHVNVVYNRTEPLPPTQRSLHSRWLNRRRTQVFWGSYSNALGLQLAVRLIDDDTRFLMSLHMDTMPSRTGWLSFLVGKIDDEVRAAGVRMDTARDPAGVLHALGCLVDFQLFRELGLDYFPELPRRDVGDRVSAGLRDAGYRLFACPNTHSQPELLDGLPSQSLFRTLCVDRSFDDDGNVIFLHLGRGIVRSVTGWAAERRTQLAEWLAFADGPGDPK